MQGKVTDVWKKTRTNLIWVREWCEWQTDGLPDAPEPRHVGWGEVMKDTQPENKPPSCNGLSISPDWRKAYFSSAWAGIYKLPPVKLVCTQQKPHLDIQLHSFHCVSRAKWCTKHQPWRTIVFPCERSLSSLLPVRLSFLLLCPYLALKDLKRVFTSGLLRQALRALAGAMWLFYFLAVHTKLLYFGIQQMWFSLLLVLGATGCSRGKWPGKRNDMFVFC